MKIVVLAGGISTERDVSLSSGSKIYRALRENGHQAVLLDVYLGYELAAKDDRLIASVFEQGMDCTEKMSTISESNPDIAQIKALRPDGDKNFFGPNVISICQAADIVFMALHGENGENGKIQAYFDLMGITYTGTDFSSSAICMDKGISKDLFACYDIPTPAGKRIKRGEDTSWDAGFPCVVKACCGGSSVGVSIAQREEDFKAALEEAFLYDNEVIIEQYVKGREFSVGLLDGKALPVIEIAPLQGFYDYKNKYQAGCTIETCPAKLTDEQTKTVQELAERAYAALRLKNYARLDFMMNEKGEFFCLEANTLPGMTPTSLLPQEAAAQGMDFPALCEAIMKSALAK